MSNYSTMSHSTDSSLFRLGHYGLQLVNCCYDSKNKQLIGGELSVDEYDRMYNSFMYLHQSTNGNIPAWLYGQNGDFRVDIATVFEDTDLFVALARDKKGSQFIQNNFPCDQEVCALLYESLLESDIIFSLSKDVFGNFVIQKILDEASEYAEEIFDYLKPHFYFMCKNRYSCRVAQKMINLYSVSQVKLLINEIRGYEMEMIIDMHASHVIQKIITSHPENTFSFIVHAITSCDKLFKEAIFNKYGCRVIQLCLDRLVEFCRNDSHKISLASNLLNKLLRPILKHAFEFSMDEFANYVIQFIITTDFLEKQRLEVIKNIVMTNVLKLSQERYASHVLEKAMIFASSECLSNILEEIFSTTPSDKVRDTLYVMLFDQYGNYVIQRLLEILIEIRNGTRLGNPVWFDRLAKRLIQYEQNLMKYSSGKKILEVLKLEIGEFSEFKKLSS